MFFHMLCNLCPYGLITFNPNPSSKNRIKENKLKRNRNKRENKNN